MRIDARVDRVTVFERGARVTRRATLSGAGAAVPPRVIAAGLPLGLLDDSVRVTARGAVAKMATVILEASGADAGLPEAIPAELRDARRAAALADGELERLRREIEVIESAPLVVEPSDRQPPIDWVVLTAARRALLELRQARLRELRQALTAATALAQQRARELAAATDADKRRSTARAPRNVELRKSIVIDLEPAAAGSDADAPEISLEYSVRGARWAPSYVARYQAGKMTWTMRAQVAQQTGEDWRGVSLRLSTAALDGHSELPELAALKIGKRQATAAKRLRPPPPGVDELFADFDRDLPRSPTGGGGRIGESRVAAEPSPVSKPQPRQDVASGTLQQNVAGVAQQNVFAEGANSMVLDDDDALATLGISTERASSRGDDTKVSKKKSGGFLGRGSAPPQIRERLAAPSPAMPMASTVASYATQAGGGAPVDVSKGYKTRMFAAKDVAEEEYAPPPEPVAELDFVGLMMAGVGHARRGTLVAMSLLERYRAPIGVDDGLVRYRLRLADNEANLVENAAVPAGYSAEWGHDFDYAIDAEARVDVASDGGWHSLPLCTRETPARVTHVAVPREAPEVFRTATGENPFDVPILPGPVDVYDGDRFLVTASAPVAAPGGELVLPLGVDASIKVARNTEYREEVTGMLRGGLRLVHELRLEVQNTAAQPIQLEVRERVPVPRQRDADDITVEVTAAQPAWQPWTPPPQSAHERELRGGYRWQLSVAPRTTAKLSATYEVRIAGKHELIGGNRRES